jgi:N-acetylglucosaminyl-diphospho-decaprenol L-rhamnosyltransferase
VRHSVIVVTWNAAEVLDRCLESIGRQVVQGGLETIVVDNASTDATEAVLVRHADAIRVIRNAENLGFSGGNNQGAEAATGEVLHFLNADTELLQPDALQRLGEALRAERVGMVGPRLVQPDGALEPSCTAHPTVPASLAVALGLHRLLPNGALARIYPRAWSHDRSRTMDWLVGAALSLHADLFRTVGGFWPMQYGEEADLARKIQDRGYTVRFVHDVSVMHVGNVSNQQRFSSPGRAGRAARAEVAYLDRHVGGVRAAAIRCIVGAGHAGRAAVLGLLRERERAAVYRSMADVYLRGGR